MVVLKHSQIFALIVKIIFDTWDKTQQWVDRDEIVRQLLIRRDIKSRLAEVGQGAKRSLSWYVGNAVDWFSKEMTDQTSPYLDDFDRAKMFGKWAYVPAGYSYQAWINFLAFGKHKGQYTYQRDQEIGRGGFGVVYKGHLIFEGSPRLAVAIKSFRSDFDDAELNLLERLRHPNIIRLLDTFEDLDGRGHKQKSLILEFADEGTLKDKIDGSPLGLSDEYCLKIAIGIARGLSYLHSREPRIIHRDIKPPNILLTAGVSQISDVGIAKLIDSTTVTHSGVQTLAYAAPEMFPLTSDKKAVVSPKVDIYAFGITMFQMLTGRLPFTAAHEFQMVLHHHNSKIPDHDKIFGWALRVIDRCTLKDYHSRWSSHELLEFLEQTQNEDKPAFFIPGIENKDEAEQRYQVIRQGLDSAGLELTDKRIFGLVYSSQESENHAEVGNPLVSGGEIVIAIFELKSGAYAVCTPSRGSDRVFDGINPILVGIQEVRTVQYFKEDNI